MSNALQIYNTLTRRKEAFTPLEPGRVRMYVCGMTVYDYCHLGHARVMVAFDVITRYLRHRGFDVTYVRNVTDIDDKILRRADENGESIASLTERMIEAMHEDEARLSVLPPDQEPRATRHIDDIIAMVETLIAKGYAYAADNGDVYYRVRKFEGYGKLNNRDLDEMRSGARVEVDEHKEDPRILLVLVHLHPRAGAHLVQVAVVELAVALELAHPVVDVAIVRRIGIALGDQGLDHGDDIVDMAGRPGLLVRRQHREARLVLVHRLDHALGERGDALAVLVGPAQDLVVDIGDVAHIGDIKAAMAQVASDDVEGHHHPGMAQVAVVVDGHAAHVHAHPARLEGREGFLAASQRVVDLQRVAHGHPFFCSSFCWASCFWTLAQLSLRLTVRLNTSLPSRQAWRSAQK